MRIRSLGAATLAVALLTLTGCVGADPLPTLPPTPSSTPLFASEEEALAAAEDAYAAYNEVSNLISNEGGANPERIAPFVTSEYLPREIESAAFLSENSLRVDGATVVTDISLQRLTNDSDFAELVVYVCISVAGTRVTDATGADVTPSDRAEVVALEVSLTADETRELLVSGSEQWPDSSFC